MSSSTPVDASQGVVERPLEGLRTVPRKAEATPSVVRAGHRRGSTVAVVATLAGLAAGTATAVVTGTRPVGALALGAWALVSLARAATWPSRTSVREALRGDARTVAALAVLAAFTAVVGLSSPTQVRHSLVVVLAAGAVTALARFVRRGATVPRKVVLVGTQQALESYVASANGTADVVAGCHVVDAGAAAAVQPTLLVPTTTSLETLPELVDGVGAEAVLVLPGAGVSAEMVRELSWAFEASGVSVGVVCPVASVSAHRLRATVSGGGTVLEVAVPRAGASARLGKAVLDRVGAAVLLVLAAPLLVVLWAAVRLDSKGPGFFVQTRVGRDGRPFRMVKLRTMHRNAEELLAALAKENELDGVLFKIRRDPRVTRVGYWLRRSSLDELPQLLNVVRGEMSLVGPRPALPAEVAAYDAVARRRLVVKPGITGLWQVSGRSDLLWEESLRLDLYYADNWRLVDDMAIACRTVTAVTRARGAY
jgi:exopolysaccharide biosynthesis polyprenyl glycosylphosphotransferase